MKKGLKQETHARERKDEDLNSTREIRKIR